jgi:hypothetical protein
VHPENEIDNRLRPAERDKYHPDDVPSAKQRSKDEPCLVRVERFHKMIPPLPWQDNERKIALGQ